MLVLMDGFLLFLTVLSFFVLLYIYGGYLFLLRVIHAFVSRKSAFLSEDFTPSVTVLLTVYNEVDKVESRIKNILDCDYPKGLLQILVASDGSVDGTDEVVKAIKDSRVSLFRPESRKGKTDTQNQAIQQISSDVIVFTDADTRFEKGFVKEIARPFSDSSVGGVDGHLLFITDEDSGVSQSQGAYWSQELFIRKYESELGILAVASGACMAVRRSIFRPMEATVGEDCLVPLDIVEQGYFMVHADKALAYDRMDSSPSSEFSTRVRMTLRNWQGTWLYPGLLNPLKNPKVAFSLWSHKLLRWLSPFFLLLWLLGSVGLLFSMSSLVWLGVPSVFFMLLAFFGMAGQWIGYKLPIASGVYSFCLANIGFLVGVVKGMVGSKVFLYR